jgi:hypothetical protein
MYIGGTFTDVYNESGNIPCNYIVRYTISGSGSSSGTNYFNGSWDPFTNMSGPIYSLFFSSSNSYLYAGGSFGGGGGISLLNTGYWNGSTWIQTPAPSPVGSGQGVNAPVYSIKYDSSNNIIINGGAFTLSLEANSNILSNYVSYFNVNNNTWNTLKETIIPYGVKNVTTPTGKVYVVLYDGISKIYVGGDFINVGGIYANSIAVYDISNNVWSALVDSNTSTNGVNAPVRSLCLFGALYVGGDFTTAGGVVVNYIAAWSPSTTTWSSLTNGGTNGPVYAITSNSSEIFVGGNFTDAGGISGVNNIASYNSGTWAALTDSTYSSSGTNGPVYAITFGSSLTNPIIIGGSFANVAGGSLTASNIVAWNGTNFAPLSDFVGNEGTNGPVYALAIGGWGISPTTNTIVYVGGAFTSVANGSLGAQYIASYDYSSASWNVVGNNSLNASVRTLHYPGQNQGLGAQDTRLFIGGEFTTAGIQDYLSSYSITTLVNGILLFQESGSVSSNSYNTLPYLSSNGGTLYSTGVNGVKLVDAVYSVYFILNSSSLIVGGGFTGCYGLYPTQLSRNIAIMSFSNTWNIMSSQQIPALDTGEVNAVVRVGSRIYVGGSFNNLITNNQVLNNFAYWDTSTYLWYSIGASSNTIGINGVVYTMELYAGVNLLVGGLFNTANTITLNGIGNFSTGSETWTQLGTGVNDAVRDIYYTSGTTAYICGDFSATGNGLTPIYRVAKINLNTLQIEQIANSSNTHVGLNNIVYSNLFLTPRIYFGGNFTNTSPVSDLPLQSLAFYLTTTTIIPLQVTTSAINGFLNTETGNTHTTITIPTRYKLIVIIYNSSLNQWLVTYRSTGVTFS